ncbi:MAG: M28 family peptidase [Cyclobacteriaceae bacterium]|nr:M28 family peptidase [Cyclobacteriaceae bacterium HetDA_MAG_MS6]
MKNLLIIASCTLSLACTDLKESAQAPVIDTVAIARHIEILSSDEFLGRKPFTIGEEKTISYLAEQFEKMGLEPGNGDSYFQEVPLVELKANPDEKLVVNGPKGQILLDVGSDFVAYSERVEQQIAISNSELVFAGFGVVAPEYGWNDYDGLDVKGKTVVVLVNDPGFGSGDSTLFKGQTMTYYGRWTYKYEEAARQGAAGVLIVHETVPAGYPWLVVRNSWSGASLYLDKSGEEYQCSIQGWVTRDAAIQLFQASGKDMKNFVEMSRSPEFKPFSLGLTASVGVKNDIKRDVSSNVIAKITGAKRPQEAIIYSAHWDHLGVGPVVDGDTIYNGAHDNASGTATMLGIAKAFVESGQRPDRTLVFLAVTAEEQGLLGSKYYAENPIFEPRKTVANINMDGVKNFGAMRDLTVVGYGQTEMDDMALEIIKGQGRYIIPDPDPGKGFFFRSDHFNFAKVGIPAFYASGSYEAMKGGTARIQELNDEFLSNRYHRPADEYMPSEWSFAGIKQDAELFYLLGDQLANGEAWPKWKEGSEFKAIRESK